MSNLNAEESRREHNERKGEILSLLDKTIEFYEKEEGNFKEKYKVDENQKYHKQITAMGLSITKKF